MSDIPIKSRPTTDAYREGWDRLYRAAAKRRARKRSESEREMLAAPACAPDSPKAPDVSPASGSGTPGAGRE